MKNTTNQAENNLCNNLILGMGIAYLLFLVWAILWKCGMPFIGSEAQRTINLHPFNNNTSWEMQFNIAVFMPLGFYLAAYKKGWMFMKLAVIIIISFILESVQFVLAIGRSDITDLVLNTFGGICGVLVFYFISLLFKKRERMVTIVLCIILTLFELYMTVSFIVFGYLNLGFMIIRL
ncbi:MAG: VanZ family protein [Eubacteriales bacterium]